MNKGRRGEIRTLLEQRAGKSRSRSLNGSDGPRTWGPVAHGLDCQRVAVTAHYRMRFRTHFSDRLLRLAEWRSKQGAVGCIRTVASI